MAYQLPEVFQQLPADDDDEFDTWEHVRNGYRVRIARYYDGNPCYWWIGPADVEVPSIYGREWTEAPNLERASKQAWSAFLIYADMDRTFGPVAPKDDRK